MSIWGKIIGGTAGFALGGPLGAILGVMAGNIYDRSIKSSFRHQEIPNNQKQNVFAISIIILAAKLSKADGIVTKDEIEAFKEKFKISSKDMQQVGKIFNEAKKTTYGYEAIAQQVGNLFQDSPIVLEELLNNLFYIAESDGKISEEELGFLKTLASIFRFDENTFERIYQSRLDNKQSDPYKVLGVKRTDTDETIRKAWIKLIKEHHPDNLVAKGMPSEFVEQATNEMSSINTSYDKIQKIRGID
jgi:DnaJ like chaperone protein